MAVTYKLVRIPVWRMNLLEKRERERIKTFSGKT